MFDDKKAQIKLGIMVFAAIFILIFTVIWGKNIRVIKSSYKAKACFTDVTGLEKGARVLVNGIPKGKVSDYWLDNGKVIVELNLDKDVILFTDAYSYLESPDLMAEKVLAVNPGKSGLILPDSALIRGLPYYSISQMFLAVGEIKQELTSTMQTLQKVGISLEETISSPDFNRQLHSTMADLSSASRSLNTLVKENQPKIDRAVDNLYSISDRAIQAVNQHDQDVEAVFKNLRAFSDDLQSITQAAKELSNLLKEKDSTLGRLTHNDEFYQEMRQAIQNLDSLITEFRKNGVKTKISLF